VAGKRLNQKGGIDPALLIQRERGSLSGGSPAGADSPGGTPDECQRLALDAKINVRSRLRFQRILSDVRLTAPPSHVYSARKSMASLRLNRVNPFT